MPDTLYTTSEAADRLGITPGRLRQLARSGGYGQRFGRDWIFTADDLQTLERRKTTRGRVPGTPRSSSPRLPDGPA